MGSSRSGRRILVIASICAVLATVFAYMHTSQNSRANHAYADGKVQLLVANHELRPGTVIQRDMVSVRELPSSEAPSGAYSMPEQVVGRVAAAGIEGGSVLTSSAVVAASAALGPAYALPKDMRAVTISADVEAGIGGFLKAGDRVDVFATFERTDESATRLVLQDVEVLAVGGDTTREGPKTEAKGSTGGSQRETPVTVAVTVPETERLVMADARGQIRLALRPAQGGDYANTRGVTETELSGLKKTKAGSAVGSAAVTVDHKVPRDLVAAAREEARLFRSIPQLPSARFTPREALRPAAPNRPVQPEQPAPPAEYEVTVVRGTKVETVLVGPAVSASDNKSGAAAQSGNGTPREGANDEALQRN